MSSRHLGIAILLLATLLPSCLEPVVSVITVDPLKVEGRVVDVDGVPVQGVVVFLVGAQERNQGLTDSEGMFVLDGLTQSTASLVVNNGAGLGGLVQLTNAGGAVVGDIVIEPLRHFPELVRLKHVEFEERLTDDMWEVTRFQTVLPTGHILSVDARGHELRVRRLEPETGAAEILWSGSVARTAWLYSDSWRTKVLGDRILVLPVGAVGDEVLLLDVASATGEVVAQVPVESPNHTVVWAGMDRVVMVQTFQVEDPDVESHWTFRSWNVSTGQIGPSGEGNGYCLPSNGNSGRVLCNSDGVAVIDAVSGEVWVHDSPNAYHAVLLEDSLYVWSVDDGQWALDSVALDTKTVVRDFQGPPIASGSYGGSLLASAATKHLMVYGDTDTGFANLWRLDVSTGGIEAFVQTLSIAGDEMQVCPPSTGCQMRLLDGGTIRVSWYLPEAVQAVVVDFAGDLAAPTNARVVPASWRAPVVSDGLEVVVTPDMDGNGQIFAEWIGGDSLGPESRSWLRTDHRVFGVSADNAWIYYTTKDPLTGREQLFRVATAANAP